MNQTRDCQIKLYDLSGEFNLDHAQLTASNNCIIQYFDHISVLKQLWKQLNPHASEWWQLLDIASKQSTELPPIPGIEDLTKLIFFSEALESAQMGTILIAILPTPLHALKILGMAQKGPALIDQLLEPLLNWWDKTRQTLSTVEKILRLRLPSSQQLRLNDAWKSRLHLLQKTISDRSNHHFTLILDGKNYKPAQLRNRLSIAGMHRAIPHILIVEEASTEANVELENECRQGPIMINKSIAVPALVEEAKTNDEKRASNRIEEWDTEKLCAKIFLPGVTKANLKIEQVDASIHLIFNGYCRSIALPTEFVSKQCERAQIALGWLTLWFSHN
ncbi:hypothetical protein SynA1524_00719 [Synechococcus sp. A15-24]|nr:hypothetical protein SynA1524_00719 [Synechococcus sp. A15-24]